MINQKLPTEIQEIIHYYTNGEHKPYNNDPDNYLDALVGLATELSPYLSNEFVPDFLREQTVDENLSVASFLYKNRKGLLSPVDPNQFDLKNP